MGGFANALTGQTNGQNPGFNTEPIEGDSLTQYLRSLTNWGSGAGQNILSQGGKGVGQSMDFYSQILGGNPSASAQYAQPDLGATADQFSAAKRGLDAYAPMGGGRANAMANLPFQQAAAQSNIIAQARKDAAAQLAQIGISEQSIGSNMFNSIINDLLNRRGQNVAEHGQAMSMATQLGQSAMAAGTNAYGINHG